MLRKIRHVRSHKLIMSKIMLGICRLGHLSGSLNFLRIRFYSFNAKYGPIKCDIEVLDLEFLVERKLGNNFHQAQ